MEKTFDVILSSWTPSRKTPGTLVASDPYYTWGLVIRVRGDAAQVRSYLDLPQARLVGHYLDPAVGQTLRSLGAAHTKAYDSEGALFKALGEGAIDALVHDSTHVRWRVNADPAFRIVGDPLNRLGYHVGVRKGDKGVARPSEHGRARAIGLAGAGRDPQEVGRPRQVALACIPRRVTRNGP